MFIKEVDECIYGAVKSSRPQAPSVVTAVSFNITTHAAVSGGIITLDGGADITLRGVCWDASLHDPTTADDHYSDTDTFTIGFQPYKCGESSHVRRSRLKLLCNRIDLIARH